MASIRKTSSGKWKSEIVIRQGAGKTPFRTSRVFDRKGDARIWGEETEKRLRQPGGIERFEAQAKAGDPTLRELIVRYIEEDQRGYGRSKADYLRRLQDFPIASRIASELEVADFQAFGRWLSSGTEVQRAPATVAGLMGTLRPVLEQAEGWGVDVDLAAYDKACRLLTRANIMGRPNSRTRRLTMDELDQLMSVFVHRYYRDARTIPMHLVVPAAIFTCRRVSELVGLRWEDLDGHKVLVRGMKHPRRPEGLDRRLLITEEARRIIDLHGHVNGEERVVPYSAEVVSRRFQEACTIAGIEDLRFHDLRHTGITWLRERGETVSHTMLVSGHVSTQSLDIYSQIEDRGDAFEGWSWWNRLEDPDLIPRKT